MELIYVALLALVQGVTEFLPVSSSAHLILGRVIMGAMGFDIAAMSPSEELALDIALHVGSLGAVLVYFRDDIGLLVSGLLDGLRGRGGERLRLVLVVIAASLPIVVVGFAAKDLVVEFGRSLWMLALSTIVFGVLLYFSDRRPEVHSRLETLSLRNAMIVGFAQCIAIIPGVSRSGICMTAGRYAGLDRPLSARLALLLSIPTILGAGVLGGLDLYEAGNARLTTDALFGGVLAFFSAWATVALMMTWLKRQTYTPFVIYRLVLGLFLIGLITSGVVAAG
ncbi:undecaprenyl-diphosphate phosphatase [Pelagibacterium montanilacus]|uniref:undecaprenyl-diphosphate phosphatase n=1 Tax=Pelagibacterium montanilacus TaxID=2185280 RepID=UPI000F8CE525|nr:undecaprenyl-diphosphate phosphatase [Pelagibacterium montanilacus]